MNVTEQQLHALGIGSEWVEPLNTTFAAFSIATPEEAAAFIGQTSHESNNYKTLEENLNYSAESLVRLWPTHFNSSNASQYARNPEKIANRAYANKGGNRDEASGDGWMYHGRGCIQLTLHDNYWHCGQAIKEDLVRKPDLVATPMYAMLSAGWFWGTHGCNNLAQARNWEALTKKINGGTIGVEDRIAKTNHALSVFV